KFHRKNGRKRAKKLEKAKANEWRRWWKKANGKKKGCAKNCASNGTNKREKTGGIRGWMRRALSKKARSQRVWRGSTAEPLGDGRTARLGSFSCTPVRKGPPSSI